jgi:PAS domain S-box-containing protein
MLPTVHIHVWAAIAFGGILSSFPIVMIRLRPGAEATAYTVAVAQALWSALLIDITGGRIETHFHIFCSLAVLSFYRHPGVLLAATSVTAIDHLARGVLWPQSVFGIFVESPWRWLEHSAWICFEDAALLFAMRHSLTDLKTVCTAQAQLEHANQLFEHQVQERTKELSASRESLNDVVDAIDAALCIVDCEGHISATNEKWNKLIGDTTGSDIRSPTIDGYVESMSRLLRNSDLRQLEAGLKNVLSRQTDLYNDRFAVRLPSGDCWREIRATPLARRNMGAVVVHLDVTKQKEIEQQLSEITQRAEQLALVARYTDNGVVITDREARIEWANDAFSRITGYELCEVVGEKPGHLLQGPDSHPQVIASMRSALRQGMGFDIEIRNYRKDGTPYDAAIECRPIRNAEGETIRFIGIQTDVTEKRRIERARESERNLLQTVLEHVPSCIFWKDRDSVYRGGNKAFAAFSGVSDSAEIVGKTDFDLPWASSNAESCQDQDLQVMTSRKAMIAVEDSLQDSVGSTRVLLTSKVPLITENDCVSGIVGIFTDITEHKRAQSDRDRLQQELADSARRAGMAEVATGVLHNVGNVLTSVNISVQHLMRILRHSRRKGLRQLSDRLDAFEFAAMNQPNTRQLIELLPRYVEQLATAWEREGHELSSELKQLIDSVEHIKDVIRIQQDYAKGGHHIESVDVASIVEDALTTIRDATVAAGIHIYRNVESSQVITIDKHKLLQILINLLSNAKHALLASSQLNKEMRINVHRCADAMMFEVIDNGVGISAEGLTKIFQLGYTTKSNGHGFGLHCSALLAIEMGGELTVASAGSGSGATFTLTIPDVFREELQCQSSRQLLSEC